MVQTARFSDGQGGLRPVTLCFPLLIILALLGNTGRVQAQTPTCEQDEATLRALLGKTAAEVDLIAQRALDNEHNCGLLRTCGVSRPPAVLKCSNVTPSALATPLADQELVCINTVTQLNVAQCNRSNCHNEYLGFQYPAVQLPTGTLVHQLSGIPDAITDYRAAVCKQSFTDLMQRMVPPNITLFGDWRYYADPLGVHTSFPYQAIVQQPLGVGDLMQCEPYDPRRRPWFAGSISSKKGVVILIDTGASNNNPASLIGTGNTKLQLAQQIAATLIDTMQANDAVAVVAFNQNVTVLDSGDLLLLTNFSHPHPEAQSLVNAIGALQTNPRASSSGFHTAVETGLTLLSRFVSGCQKILIVLSDGQNFGAFPGFDPIALNQIIFNATVVQNQPITPFFISVGEEITVGDSTLQGLACSTNGVWMRVPNGDNILYNMYGYFNFLARTSQFVNQSYYSRQYMDASGLGSIFTVARLVFDNVTGDWLGTAAGDTSLDALQTYCPTAKARVLNTFLQKTAGCPVNISISGIPPCLIPAVRTSIIRTSQNFSMDNLEYCPTPPSCIIPPVVQRCDARNVTRAVFRAPGQGVGPAVNYCCGSCTTPL